MTLSKLAAMAHVSVSTASKAFSMSREVNDETKEMIFQIAREQGCFKKFYNAKYPKFVIAVICPEFESLHYANTFSRIQKICAEYNCEVCGTSTNFSVENETELLEYYEKYAAVDGIIVVDGRTKISGRLQIPAINLKSWISSNKEIEIVRDFRDCLREVIEFFLSREFGKIGFIGENHTTSKLKIFREVLEEQGMEADENLISITQERMAAGGYSAMEELFRRGTVPEALICAYDYMAIGAIRSIRAHGLSVPEDVAVMGMDNIPESEYLTPSLTTIEPYTEKSCRLAVAAIVSELTGEKITVDKTLICEVIWRESTGKR